MLRVLAAAEEPLPEINVHMLRNSLGGFNKRTAACGHGWSPPELLLLSDEALQGFVSILNLVEKLIALPAQDLYVVIAMLGKALEVAGDRPVALLGLVYRILMAVRKM